MNLVAVIIGWWIAWLPPAGAVGPDLSCRDTVLRVPAATAHLDASFPSCSDDARLIVSMPSPAEDDDSTDGDALDLAIAWPLPSDDTGRPALSSHLSDAIRPPCPRTFPIRC